MATVPRAVLPCRLLQLMKEDPDPRLRDVCSRPMVIDMVQAMDAGGGREPDDSKVWRADAWAVLSALTDVTTVLDDIAEDRPHDLARRQLTTVVKRVLDCSPGR